MAETQEGLQQTSEEVKIGQIIKFLQSFGVLLTENRDILTVLPELIKKLEANITKAAATATSDIIREFSGLTEEQEGEKKKWERQQKRQEKQISRLENELQEAKKKILDLEAKNEQNDNDVEMLKRENGDLSDKNYYKSKYKDFKAKLRMTNTDLQAKKDRIAELGEKLRAKQEDYDKETQRSGKELVEKEKELAKMREQLNTVKQQHDESLRDQKTKIDELQARVAQLEGERLSLQEDCEKERQRSKQEMTEKDKDNEELTRENKEWRKRIAELGEELRAKQEDYDKETQRSRKELAEKEKEFKHQEEQHKSDLSLKEIEVKKLKQRLSQREKEVKRLNEELGQFKSRFAGICEKRVKQDQRKVENILASNQQSEVENDFREFFDSSREDARDIIQSLYGSEEEIDVHVYYPRIACIILEIAYEHANDVKEAVIDLFKVVTKNMVLHAPQEGYNFRLKRTEGSFDIYPISIGDLNTSEKSTDVLDALLISLKETAHICNLQCLEKDVAESSLKKWTEWFDKNVSLVHAPTQEVLVKLDSYIKACIRLTWRMVTQLPPLRLEYHSPRFDRHIHKKTAYQNTTEKNPGNEESLGEEIFCYLWPGLLDGGDRLILQGQVLCKMQRGKLK